MVWDRNGAPGKSQFVFADEGVKIKQQYDKCNFNLKKHHIMHNTS